MEQSNVRKLPPLSLNPKGDEPIDTPIKRKKKRLPVDNEGEVGSPGRPQPRPSSSRVRTDSESRPRRGGDDGAEPGPSREVTRKPKKHRPTVPVDDGSTSEGPNESPKPRKKKKQPIGTSQEQLVTNGDVAVDQAGAPIADRPKKKKKKKQRSDTGKTSIGLEHELRDLEDDVVMTEDGDRASIDDSRWTNQAMRSEPVPKLFIEQRNGFKTANRNKVVQRRAEEQQRAMTTPTAKPTKTTSQLAVSSHKVFKTFTVFLQGLFAGIALWQVTTVWLLSNSSWDNLLEDYAILARPVQCMFYWLFAVSTVAVFDRNDIARPTRRFAKRSAAMQTGAISCLFYFVGLVMSLSIAFIDEKISMSQVADLDPPIWATTEERDAQLYTWRIMNLVRGLMPMLGWFVISLRPGTDRLTKNLEKADENIMGEEEQPQTQFTMEQIRSSGV